MLSDVLSPSGSVERIEWHLARIGRPDFRDALELGCGRAHVSALLAEAHGMRVVASDVSRRQIEAARRRHRGQEGLRLLFADAARLPLASESFDLVVARNLFHHLPDWRRAVGETARVLRPSGCLLWHGLVLDRAGVRRFARLTGVSGLFTGAEIRAAFSNVGLTVESAARVTSGPVVRHDLVLRKSA